VTPRVAGDSGITMVEVAVILVVTLAIIGVLAPTISAVILRAETVAATTALNDIDQAINNVLGDMNYTFFNFDGVKNSEASRVFLMVGDGDTPREVSGTGSATWQQAVNATTVEFLEWHLLTNTPAGNPANAYNPPGAATEWRGAYLNGPMDPDPWGNRYMVNVEYLGASNNDVVVYSAGPDEEIDSAFTALNFNTLTVDDDLYVIQEAN
jgi:hypothetical protein